MSFDPDAAYWESLGLHFKSPWDVLNYHPAAEPTPEPKVRGRLGKPFMTEEERKKRHAEICKAYQATQHGKEIRAAARAKRAAKRVNPEGVLAYSRAA